jgi:hypothetical protein
MRHALTFRNPDDMPRRAKKPDLLAPKNVYMRRNPVGDDSSHGTSSHEIEFVFLRLQDMINNPRDINGIDLVVSTSCGAPKESTRF